MTKGTHRTKGTKKTRRDVVVVVRVKGGLAWQFANDSLNWFRKVVREYNRERVSYSVEWQKAGGRDQERRKRGER